MSHRQQAKYSSQNFSKRESRRMERKTSRLNFFFFYFFFILPNVDFNAVVMSHAKDPKRSQAFNEEACQ